jgi:hypothetical protein
MSPRDSKRGHFKKFSVSVYDCNDGAKSCEHCVDDPSLGLVFVPESFYWKWYVGVHKYRDGKSFCQAKCFVFFINALP